MRRGFLGFAIICCCAVPAFAAAQEAGKTGVTMSFPASVGIIWHATEKVAVRPDLSFSHASSDFPQGEGSTDNLALGVSVLFYTHKWDNAAAYFAPRFAWSHGSSESRADIGGFESDSSADAFTYAGSFGAQGWVGSRFSVFGEVGLSYFRGSSDSSSGEVTNRSFAIRSGVGAILYF